MVHVAMMAQHGSQQTIWGPIVGERSVAQVRLVTWQYETHGKEDK